MVTSKLPIIQPSQSLSQLLLWEVPQWFSKGSVGHDFIVTISGSERFDTSDSKVMIDCITTLVNKVTQSLIRHYVQRYRLARCFQVDLEDISLIMSKKGLNYLSSMNDNTVGELLGFRLLCSHYMMKSD